MPTQPTLSRSETRDLRALAGLMIPASIEYNMPGADDEVIFDDILNSLERDVKDVRVALCHLQTISGGAFAEAAPDRRAEIAARFKAEGGAALLALNRMVLLCYYRDGRVMRSLGLEPRSPFPKGHTVEQGDWSLLEAVKSRPPIWRKV
jgi:hypothetical protein